MSRLKNALTKCSPEKRVRCTVDGTERAAAKEKAVSGFRGSEKTQGR
jgi:hypothetical protein